MKQNKTINKKLITLFVLAFSMTFIHGCGSKTSPESGISNVEVAASSSGEWNNEIKVLKPVASGVNVIGSDVFSIDISNANEGYIVVKYTGDSDRVKFQLSGNNQVTYTYNITPLEETVVPLCAGSGEYSATAYENIGGDQYSSNFADSFSVDITNTFGPFLYPNQYVNFTEDSEAVKKAQEIVAPASCDLEAVGLVYQFVTNHVSYDKEEATHVETSYLPDIDEVLSTGKGICFDYSSLMAAMLRSQGIPTKLEIGYAKDAYHAWISVYTKDQGWIGGIIQFDGSNWTLIDPTLASNAKDVRKIKDFIGDGSAYTVKYSY